MTPENLRIQGLSIKQLDALAAAIAQRREFLVYEERKELRQRILEVASQAGFTLQELFPDIRRGTREVTEAKGRLMRAHYRNPLDPAQVWPGRGPKPRWFKAAVAAGTPPVAMRVLMD